MSFLSTLGIALSTFILTSLLGAILSIARAWLKERSNSDQITIRVANEDGSRSKISLDPEDPRSVSAFLDALDAEERIMHNQPRRMDREPIGHSA